jgi:hypothetical protein
MAYWSGEIVFKRDWTAHSEKETPRTIYDWHAEETQTWTLNGLPTADIQDPMANIYDLTWTITGSGEDSYAYPGILEKATGKWTINGSNKSGSNNWPREIRIKELSNYIWRLEPTAGGKVGVPVIELTEKLLGQNEKKFPVNWDEQNIPTIAVEKSAYIVAIPDRGSPGGVTGRPGFRRWSSLPESLRKSLSGWITHEIPIPSSDIVSYAFRDPRDLAILKHPWIKSWITGTCTWSWRLEER